MKPILALLLAFLPAVRLSAQEATTPPSPPLSVAVLSFDSSDETFKNKSTELSALLAAHLSTQENLWMVDREEMEKLLAEQTIALSGLTDPASAAKAGKIIGAKILVTGRTVRSGNGAILVAKVISSETSRVFGVTATAKDSNALEPSIVELSDSIGKLVQKQRTALAPSFGTREERIAKIKESLKGKALPALRIHVAEQDLSRVVIDPAVETELGKIALELGGQVVDANHSGDAAVSITGEAISQTGARRGQLVSARARVEIKVTRASDNKVLAIDRETSSAVDTTDAIAGKSALQNAAMELAERIFPTIVNP